MTRILLFIAFGANIVVTLVSLAVLPDRVAIHFGANGMADGWAPNYMNALLMTGIQLVLFCAVYYTPGLILRIPPKWVNMPNKQYWLSPENRLRTRGMVQRMMWHIGIALFTFLCVVGVLAIQANMTTPARLNLYVFLPALVAFLLYAACWSIAFFRAFRLPKGI